MRFHGGQFPGGLGEHVVVAEQNLLPVPDGHPGRAARPDRTARRRRARRLARSGRRQANAPSCSAPARSACSLRSSRARGASKCSSSSRPHAVANAPSCFGLSTVDVNSSSGDYVVAERIRPEGADVVLRVRRHRRDDPAALSARPARAAGPSSSATRRRARSSTGLALQRGDRSLVGVLMYEREDFIEAMDLLANGLLDGARRRSRSCSASRSTRSATAFSASKDGTLTRACAPSSSRERPSQTRSRAATFYDVSPMIDERLPGFPAHPPLDDRRAARTTRETATSSSGSRSASTPARTSTRRRTSVGVAWSETIDRVSAQSASSRRTRSTTCRRTSRAPATS